MRAARGSDFRRAAGRPLEAGALIGNRQGLPDLKAENELVVEADLPYSSTGEAMHHYVDPLDGQKYVGAYLGVENTAAGLRLL